MKQFLYILFLVVCSVPLSAQSMEQFIEDADQQFELENYFGAYDSYRIALEFDEDRMDLWFKRGESARLYTAYELALESYQRIMRSGQQNEFPDLQLRMGEVNQRLGNYEEAVSNFEQYLAQNEGGDTNILKQATKSLEDSRWAQQRVAAAESIEITHLPRDINTQYSDFGYVNRGDKGYFSSNRNKYEEDELAPVRYLSRIYHTMDGTQTTVVEDMLSDPPQEGIHTAHTAFNTAGDRVYYTICEYVGDTESTHCDLYFSSVDAAGNWGTPVRMAINAENATNTHPNVALDPDTGNEWLFFVSDRADDNGAGARDIYRATLNANGSAMEVVNLTDINTEHDEVTPFFDTRTRRLYFSTDGRETLGGLDIYWSTLKDGTFGTPQHLNSPINSSFQDRYYLIDREEKKAYFSSNRQDSVAIFWSEEREACCDDIYSAPYDETIILDVYTYRKLDKTDLLRSTVSLYLRNTDGSRELIETKTQPDSIHFVFRVEPGNFYELEATRPGYGPAVDSVDITGEMPEERRIRRDMYLPQLLIVNVFDEETREALNNARVRVAESEAAFATSSLFDEIDPNGNRYEFLTSLERPYYVYAEREKYLPKGMPLTIIESDIDANGIYIFNIYLPKPKPIDLVPVDLFFDNDRPHKSSRRITSDLNYEETNTPYYARKAAFIEDQIKPGMSEEEEFQTRGQLEDFFEQDVKGGMNDLKLLADVLHEQLELGVDYSMVIEGAASARGNPAYNLNLSQRRVDSVIKFLKEYDNGKLADYISDESLRFKKEWVGDTKADASDKSVYGLRASRDRRVTISELKVIN